MSNVIGDPDELDSFALSLSQFIETINDAVNDLNYSFGALRDTWQDEKRVRFEEEYDALLQQLDYFENNASEQILYLQALASRLRDYLES